MTNKDLLNLANNTLLRAIMLALPTIQKQAGNSTLQLLNFQFPQGEFTEMNLSVRMCKSFWQKNPMIEFRITGIKGYLVKDKKDGNDTRNDASKVEGHSESPDTSDQLEAN